MPEVRIHASKVEMVPVAALKGYEKNARTHPDSQVSALMAIIQDSGFTNPLLIDDANVIVGGHGRLLAAKKLKMTEVPCVRLRDLTPDQIKAIRLSDNATGLLSGWDDNLLRTELGDLKALGFDLSLTGFASADLSKLFGAPAGRTDPDDAPEPPPIPTSRRGDMFILGDHRIICGDATNATDVEKVLGGARPHLMATDPPYGVQYDADWRNHTPDTGRSARATGKVMNDDKADWREAWALFHGDVVYIWHAGIFAGVVADSLQATGFEIRSQIIWRKQQFAIGRGDYHWQHEPCWYAVRKGRKGHFDGGRKQTTVWDIDKPRKSETGHSTQKPVECMKRPIENNSKVDDHIYEPFSGSGTTIIAGQMTGRIVHAVELNPAYVDVAVRRWMDFTGQEAFHEDGTPWSDLVQARIALEEAVG